MSNVRLILLLGGIAAVTLAGCIFSPKKDDPVLDRGTYPVNLSQPESLVVQLEVSYRRREPDPYGTLLASDFKFIFLEADAQGLPKDFYTHDEDSVATANLFEGQDLGGTGGNVTDIKIDLTTLGRESATLDEFPGVDVQLIRVINTFLDVNLDNGTTLRVSGDQQLFYYRKGDFGAGEDSTRWYFLQWQDLGGLGASPKQRELKAEGDRTIIPATMSQVRRYLNP